MAKNQKLDKKLDKFERDLKKTHKLLCLFFPNREDAHKWLYLKNDILLGRTPRDLIKEGRIGHVLGMIKRSVEYQFYLKEAQDAKILKKETIRLPVRIASIRPQGPPEAPKTEGDSHAHMDDKDSKTLS